MYFLPKKAKKTRFSEISVADFLAGNRQRWPICSRWGPANPKVRPKFFLWQTDKNSRFYLKKTYPPKKEHVLGGSGNHSPVNLDVSWAERATKVIAPDEFSNSPKSITTRCKVSHCDLCLVIANAKSKLIFYLVCIGGLLHYHNTV